jgi:V8-like Glu-specific endopeptidase
MWRFTELTHFLSSLYYRQDDIFALLIRSGLKPQQINQSTNAVVFWTNIIQYAEGREKIENLLATVLADGHQGNEYIISLIGDLNSTFKSPYLIEPALGSVNVKKEQVELLTSGRSTFLPIAFLTKGIEKSRSVARVVTSHGLGTGFSVGKSYFLTNNHVIGSKEVASNAKIQFDYELGSNGSPIPFKEFLLDPEANGGFFTSAKDDWTLVKIKDYMGEFDAIQLRDVLVSQNDFVNIVQHPGGEYKQIAIYHNLVIAASTDRVQYLTDTLPGSSGSPVFNSKWEVVALHHRGSSIKTSGANYLCNQGININLIIKELGSLNVTL